SGYLGLYWILFIYAGRWMLHDRSFSLGFSVAIAWIGQEYIRNYLLSGLSACMLGHTMVHAPVAMQIAACFGSYGVSLFVVAGNLLVFQVIRSRTVYNSIPFPSCCKTDSPSTATESNEDSMPCKAGSPETATSWRLDSALSIGWIGWALVYGVWKLEAAESQNAETLGTYVLIQRSEPVEYIQPTSRAIEIYQAYVRETLDALSNQAGPIDAIVWPESMYSAGNPWMEIEKTKTSQSAASLNGLRIAAEASGLTVLDLRRAIGESQKYFQQRSQALIDASQATLASGDPVQVLAGCGVMRYAAEPEVYCGLVQIGQDGAVQHWYGKNHLVMFGEYIPVLSSIPYLKDLLPPGMGLKAGSSAQPFDVNGVNLLPNICLETAVERVAVNHVRELREQGQDVDAIVTVTNDGWFDRSSVVTHHLHCAQFVAVSTGLPILSAANNGPTAWIDSEGRIVRQLGVGSNGYLVAEPKRPQTKTLYTRIGDWPARCLGLYTCLPVLAALIRKVSDRRNKQASD
ncbi:MAG: nitrilase-related carbon-nitrogen hydrolase, partial [Planctomycetota bacterium]|nr:nitrilase-related carbon-nitrogen hydrolase [Planctomycetota bacterium]